MRAFVTGISGQDGSYLAERLLAAGHEVHALTRADDPPAFCPPEVVVHTGDVTELDETRQLMLDLAPDQVYNLAAISSVWQSWEQPDLTSRVNAQGAVALLESAWQVQQSTGREVSFVQASSAEMFGDPPRAPQDEDTPMRPVNPYGAAKAYAHLMVGVYRGRGLGASSLILYNHESPRRPHRFVTRKITSTVVAISRGETDRLVLGNLNAKRDWGWAPDVVDAMVRACDRPGDYVIGTGASHSVRDFVAAAFARVGIRDWTGYVKVDPALVRPADAVDLRADWRKAKRDLGWEPTKAFADVVAAMVEADLSV